VIHAIGRKPLAPADRFLAGAQSVSIQIIASEASGGRSVSAKNDKYRRIEINRRTVALAIRRTGALTNCGRFSPIVFFSLADGQFGD
jgi:hypothetical protein